MSFVVLINVGARWCPDWQPNDRPTDLAAALWESAHLRLNGWQTRVQEVLS